MRRRKASAADSHLHYLSDWGVSAAIQIDTDGAVIENNDIVATYKAIVWTNPEGVQVSSRLAAPASSVVERTPWAVTRSSITGGSVSPEPRSKIP